MSKLKLDVVGLSGLNEKGLARAYGAGGGVGATCSGSRRGCGGVLRCCRFEVNVIVVGISATGIHCVLADCR